MLEPEGRHLLLDALRPPPGYGLDRAIGTTYTLDLAALLTAPVAFALIDREGTDGAPRVDPVRLLEAVRHNAERIDIFCQAGLIALPSAYQPILSYVESSVHEVEPRKPEGIFHPKVWVIRYRETDGDGTRYRLLCLSRNLTFDRSWDTVLRLEGTPGNQNAESKPLANFVEQLPKLARQSLSDDTQAAVNEMAQQLRSVTFEPPPGIDKLRFWPLGLDAAWPFDTRRDRMLVVSPFVTAGCLERLNRKGADGRDFLTSRPETFERLGSGALTRFAETFVLHTGTEITEDEQAGEAPTEAESAAERPGVELRGLHAKLYVADAGWRAKVWTGSANATDAAFGPNIEFLVEMEGKKDRCGVDAFISKRQDGLALRDLLEGFEPQAVDPREESDEERLERRLDVARRELAGYEFTARVDAEENDTYSVQLVGRRRRRPIAGHSWEGITIHGRPLTMAAAYGKAVEPESDEIVVDFGSVSFEALTSFYAFELSGREGSASLTVGFLVNAKLVGAPADRRERTLVNLLRNRSDLLRFLLFLLGGDGGERNLVELGPNLTKLLAGDGDGHREIEWQNLFEPMVRALARDPSKLDDIDRLVRDLQRTDEGRQLLPDEWDAIWEPIWAVRGEGGGQ
jgi:hypothetical protein